MSSCWRLRPARTTNGDGKIDQNDVVVAVQHALDGAAVTGGITPGFLSRRSCTGSRCSRRGSTRFQHGATDDEAFEVVVPLTPATISTNKGTLAVPGTTGNFTITIAGVTTNTIAIGSGAQVVQSAIKALQGFTDTVTVTLSGNTYTLTFGATPFSAVSGMVVLNGSVPVASEDTVAHFEAALQSQVLSLLQTAGIGAGTITVGDDGSSTTHPKLTISSSSLDFGLAFQEPVVATVGGGRISLTAPQVLRTADTSLPSLSISRSVNADVSSFNDASLQVLGLATSPTRLTYSSALTEIDFTLFVNNATIPIALTAANLSGVTDISGLVNALQTKIDAALAASFASGELTAPAQIQVCRPNINPAAGACDDVGNRITFLGVSGVTTLSIDVPAKLANGTTDNGAVTELGFQAIAGATSHGQAGRFFLNNVHLTGTVELVLQDVSCDRVARLPQPHRHRHGHAARAAAPEPHRGHPAAESARPRRRPGSVPARHRHAHQRDPRRALPLRLDRRDDGRLEGHAVHRLLPGQALGRLRRRPEHQAGRRSLRPRRHGQRRPHVQRDERRLVLALPDARRALLRARFLRSILSKFQNLDYGSITQALLLIVNFVKGLNQPGTAIGDVLSAPLPLINQSLGDLLDIASRHRDEDPGDRAEPGRRDPAAEQHPR